MEEDAHGATPIDGSDGFDAWYSVSFPRMLRTVHLAVGEHDLAVDVTAEAFTRALERWSSVSAMANRDGWVFRVAVNLARSTLRRRVVERAWRARQRPDAEAATEVPDPELWSAVSGLSPRQREAVALRYVAGMTEAEVADAMGVREGTASATLAAARRRLHEALEGGSR